MAQPYSLSVVADSSVPAGGHAYISVHGVTAPPDDEAIMIRRHDHTDRHLGPTGWQGPEVSLRPLETRHGHGVWALRFGPEVVDVIEEGTPVEIEVLGLGFRQTLHWPALLISVDAGGRRARTIAARPKSPDRGAAPDGDATVATTVPASEDPPLEPTAPEPQAPDSKEDEPPTEVAPAPEPREPAAVESRDKPWFMIIALSALLALLVVGGALYHLYGSDEDAVAPQPAPETETETETEPETEPASQAPSGGAAERAQAFLRDNPTAELAFQRAEEALAQGDLAFALFLYEYAEDQGHGPAIAAIGKFYDPVFYREGGATFTESNPRRALGYYRRAQAAGHEGSAALIEGLRAWLRERAGQGDSEAQSILNEVE